MRYKAQSFCYEPGNSYEVTEAIVTGDRISIDWAEGSESGHLEASSEDGVTYRGSFGYRQLDPIRHVEFELFSAKNGHILLFGRWWNDASGNGEEWVFQLTPEA